jgi:GT2 family glycosyltransferase
MMPRSLDPSAAAPRLSVSVVTHDSEPCLPELLAGLARQEGVTWEVRFVDCASRDGTREILRAAALGELEASAENLGYGRGHNRNLAHARGEHVLLLNPDLHLGPGLFAGLVAHLDAHPEHGLVGPRILEGEARRPFPPRRFYPGEGMIALEPGLRRRELAWLSGCCLAARRSVLAELGGFDPDFFLYQAETDLCLRARRAGHRLGYAEHLVVHHLHRQSQRALSDYEHARRIFEGSALFWEKHYAPRDVRRLARFQLALCQLLLPAAHAFGRARRWPSQLAAPRLSARRDLCRQLVAATPPAPRAPGRGASILVRQLRLALAWLTAGSFPLDDY